MNIDCIECMAASDNVVRSGLTPKFKDVKTLVSMLTYKHGSADAQVLKGAPFKNHVYSTLYDPPIEEFSIVRSSVPAGVKESFEGFNGPSILLVVDGQARMECAGKVEVVGKGGVYFVGAGAGLSIESLSDSFTAYRAFCEI
jgi:mannose-6-phosphate isomerase